jgi:hypothetical protein
MKILFKNVGRGKFTWEADVKTFTESALVRAIKKKKALMSNDIDVVENPSGGSGIIVVGGFHNVGEWFIVKEPAEISLTA